MPVFGEVSDGLCMLPVVWRDERHVPMTKDEYTAGGIVRDCQVMISRRDSGAVVHVREAMNLLRVENLEFFHLAIEQMYQATDYPDMSRLLFKPSMETLNMFAKYLIPNYSVALKPVSRIDPTMWRSYLCAMKAAFGLPGQLHLWISEDRFMFEYSMDLPDVEGSDETIKQCVGVYTNADATYEKLRNSASRLSFHKVVTEWFRGPVTHYVGTNARHVYNRTMHNANEHSICYDAYNLTMQTADRCRYLIKNGMVYVGVFHGFPVCSGDLLSDDDKINMDVAISKYEKKDTKEIKDVKEVKVANQPGDIVYDSTANYWESLGHGPDAWDDQSTYDDWHLPSSGKYARPTITLESRPEADAYKSTLDKPKSNPVIVNSDDEGLDEFKEDDEDGHSSIAANGSTVVLSASETKAAQAKRRDPSDDTSSLISQEYIKKVKSICEEWMRSRDPFELENAVDQICIAALEEWERLPWLDAEQINALNNSFTILNSSRGLLPELVIQHYEQEINKLSGIPQVPVDQEKMKKQLARLENLDTLEEDTYAYMLEMYSMQKTTRHEEIDKMCGDLLGVLRIVTGDR